MNQLIDKGGLDLTLNETTWPNSSYADIQGRLQGKKTDKGGQHVLLLDSKRRYMYAWTPRHKFFEVVQPFTATGPAEVKRLVDNITPLVVGATKDPTDKRKQIFSECVHITMDNLFSGDEVLRYLGEGGWKGTMTCRRDRLPKSVPKKYFNFIKAAPVNARSKVARFETPIVAVKHVKQPDSDEPNSDTEKKANNYTLCHVSFQSTGGTNISTVNALSSVELYVRDRSKGRGQQKRTWGIEMNEAQETYLKTYSAVDKIDQMLLHWDLNYRSWRWWHASTRHAKAIAMSHILCTFSAPKVLWIQNGRSLLSQDQSFARRCLFRWYSTGHLTCVIQGMISCVTLLRRTSESVDQSKLVLLNVKIMSRESPIRNTLMKNNQEEPKKLGYALEI